MSFLDVTLILFLILVILNYGAHRSVLYPPFIFCSMWLLDLIVFRSGLIEVDPVHNNTLAIVAAGAVSFSAGGLLAGLAPRRLLSIHLFPPKPKRTPHFLRNLLMVILLCGLPVMFYQTWRLSLLGSGDGSILAQARGAMVKAAENGELPDQPFVLNYFTPIAISISLLLATEKKDKQFWIVTVIAFIGCILSTGRGGFLLLISGLSTIRMLQTKQDSLQSAMRLLRWPIILFLTMYIGLIFTNKNTEGINGGVTGIATYFVLSYIVGPLAGFDVVVQQPAKFVVASSHTFQFPLYLGATLHLIDYTRPPLIDTFVFVPFPANVYTIYKWYFLEVGILGTLAFLLLFGFAHSLFYLKAKQGGRFSIYLFAPSILSVLLVISGDTYYDIGALLRVAALGLLYFLIGAMPFRLLPTIKVSQIENPHPESSSV
ncbi:O-antigen polymerase [Granulicella sp. S156]|uniref:O-antigen polymerase n=1 Tax=Granulicella sp. S156 TaxID=1747224 RepID=UPI00131ECA58|nr:O-antigen polymerase [Granulicella sp. S156]